MKLRAPLIAGSLVFNVALLATLVVRPAYAPPGLREFLPGYRPAAAPPPRAAKPAGPKPVRQPLWPKLDAGEDLRTLVARLRAAGFPADIVRAIVMSELAARYDTQIRAIFEPDASTPFWKARPNLFGAGDNRMERYGQLQRERARLQRELLTDPFFASDDVTAAQRRQFGNLPRQKIDLLQRIEDDYAEMMAAVRSSTNGILLAEDRDKLALLQRERRADLAATLTPAELADYEMRSSQITSMLARQLGGFNASEAEFRTIFQAQQAYSEKVSSNPMSRGNWEERQEAQRLLNQQLKAGLGDARFADYQRESDSVYQQLARLGQRENIPADTVLRAYNIKDSVAQESARIADDAALSADQKRAALQTLAERTRTDLLAMLGPNAGPTYVKLVDSRWLNTVQRGNAVSFDGAGGGAMVFMSGGGMPVSVSFGVSPSFRSVTPPRPRP